MAEILHPANIEHYINSLKINPNLPVESNNLRENDGFIDDGADSMVYRYGDNRVIKVYKEGLDFLPQIQLYDEVTREASDLLKIERYNIHISKKDYRVRVNKIEKIFSFSDQNILCATSIRIPGIKLESLYFGSYEDENLESLSDLQDLLDHRIGVRGINLAICNVKLSPYRCHTPTFMITDLCGHIWSLKRGQ